jgi:hypothetical protein
MEILLIGLLYVGLGLGVFALYGLPWLFWNVLLPCAWGTWTYVLRPLGAGIYYWTVGD